MKLGSSHEGTWSLGLVPSCVPTFMVMACIAFGNFYDNLCMSYLEISYVEATGQEHVMMQRYFQNPVTAYVQLLFSTKSNSFKSARLRAEHMNRAGLVC